MTADKHPTPYDGSGDYQSSSSPWNDGPPLGRWCRTWRRIVGRWATPAELSPRAGRRVARGESAEDVNWPQVNGKARPHHGGRRQAQAESALAPADSMQKAIGARRSAR